MRKKISFFYKVLQQRGINFLNDYMPRCWEYADVYSEMYKSLMIIVAMFSLIMMFSFPYGFLYACFPRPVYMPIIYLHELYTSSGVEFFPPTPEWGIHYLTLFMYSLASYFGIEYFEKQKINAPIQKLGYVFFLTILTFFVPFELAYITLYDVFHSIPKYGYPVIWSFGWWKKPIEFILGSVISHDIGISLICIFGMYVLYDDLKDYYDIKIIFNKKSKILLVAFFISMLSWVLIPLYQDVPSWGSKWFPQTIYVEYGYYDDYNITNYQGDEYGVVNEYWYPNDIVKWHNHISKFISVVFMFYTFIPRRVVNNVKRRVET